MKHDLHIKDTGEIAANTGRALYRVVCTGCRILVHEGTTAPHVRVREHLNGDKGYERPLVDGVDPEFRKTPEEHRAEAAAKVAKVQAHHPEVSEHDLEEGGWDCEPSPTGFCWYNLREDPAQDFCLFCGGPDERL